jgi:methylated-DNA-[protein]-cysteine S-methyltransferase
MMADGRARYHALVRGARVLDRPRRQRRRISATAGPVGAWASLESPWGPVWIAASDQGLAAVQLEGSSEGFVERVAGRLGGLVVPLQPGLPPAWERLISLARAQLAQFFAGTREAFDLPIDLRGLSDWDRRVLDATRLVGFGRVTSYGRLAEIVGAPGAGRAVGGSVGRNPVWIVVPCHRVISGDGKLGGYGGGARMLRLKRVLLAREGVTLPARRLLA